jgi:hypothetical protein
LTRKIANSSETAVSAFSPPDVLAHLLAGRVGGDLDAGLEQVALVGERQLGAAAPE